MVQVLPNMCHINILNRRKEQETKEINLKHMIDFLSTST